MGSKISFGNVEIFPHNMNINFMKWRYFCIGISVLLTIASIVVIAFKGVNYSIDFLGGAEVSLRVLDVSITRDKIVDAANKAQVGAVEVTSVSKLNTNAVHDTFLLRIGREKNADELATGKRADVLIQQLVTIFGKEKIQIGSVTNISGKIGNEEQTKGYLALLLAFVSILIYVSFRFDSRFAPGAVICLIHDVVIALGFMTLLGRPFSVSSIAAFLTIVGYSCNDTIIVYDRIRETQTHDPRMPLVEVINRSINQTMNRTILTSATGLIALLVLVFYGGGAIEDFALTMFIGILVGTYSSIYVAAPLTLVMDEFLDGRGWKRQKVHKAKMLKDPNYIAPVVLRKRSDQK